MGERPSGTVTFLFTDIEGSTRLWETDPAGMRSALAAHDEMVRAAVDAHDGYVFSTGGDGVAVAFARAAAAVDAAVDAQRALRAWPWPPAAPLRVRMGIATGEAEERDGDYFGLVLNHAARVMAAGHGGQILLAAVTAGLVDGVDLVDLGVYRLRDLSGSEHVFQVRADGLSREFPPLRTIDTVPGNLPVPSTSFVGRLAAVEELIETVRAHRLVTLTGVGGVGKTRLALRVAGELLPECPEGVWLVELAPLGDPEALPDVVAAALGVTPQAGQSVTDGVVQALSGRRLLIVLDNCEHVLDAAAGLVEAVLASTTTVRMIVTSREGLRVGPEQLWPVPSLATDGDNSEAVELFVERARSVKPAFMLDEARTVAVSAICRRLDGIALAIELAAARMVSMTPQDVSDRLADRFRLLAGGRRGVERHQTLRHAVTWSYELLDGDERTVLDRCSVFAGGFDLAAASHVCDEVGGLDEYRVLDVLESLVRKSLVNVEELSGHARYWLLETIRQFAEEQLAAAGVVAEVRDRHGGYYAAQAVVYWDLWDGPRQGVALDWVDAEFANLRAGFRWAADHSDLVTATAIAAHTPMLAWPLMRYEAAGWAEELLAAAAAARSARLSRLYLASSLCLYTGRPEACIAFAQTAKALERYDGFPSGWSSAFEAAAHFFAGRAERGADICADRVAHLPPGSGRALCAAVLLIILPLAGRAEEARLIAEETLAETRVYGNPFWISLALHGYGNAFADSDPLRALKAYRDNLEYSRQHRMIYMEVVSLGFAAWLEALYGDLGEALELFDSAIDMFHRAGSHANLAEALARLAVSFERMEQLDVAARLYGASTRYGAVPLPGQTNLIEHLRSVLGQPVLEAEVASGAEMDFGDAVAYARQQIRLARPTQQPT